MISRYQVHVGHITGAANLPSDYTSRNPAQCPDHSCQVCKFITETEDSVVRGISVHDIIHGHARMPFTNRNAWYSTQLECPDLPVHLPTLNRAPAQPKKPLDLRIQNDT